MITGEAMEVRFGLRLLDKAEDYTYCHNYPGYYQGTAARAVLVK